MIHRELKIGDVVKYEGCPEIGGTVIGFRADGNIAILSTMMDEWIFPNGTTKGKTNREFIWRFNVDSKGIITYNTMWSIVFPLNTSVKD